MNLLGEENLSGSKKGTKSFNEPQDADYRGKWAGLDSVDHGSPPANRGSGGRTNAESRDRGGGNT